jgi:hypothetical protein
MKPSSAPNPKIQIMNPKSFLTSKTIWGIIIAGAGTLLSHFHIALASDEVNTIAANLAQIAGLLFAAYGRTVATQPLTVKTPPASLLLFCLLAAGMGLGQGCATLTGTTDPAQQAIVIEGGVRDAVNLGATAEIGQNPDARQYFAAAAEALNALTANGAPTLTQINAELAKVVPAKYQDLIAAVTQIAADKYAQWYSSNRAQITASQNAATVLAFIAAARDGLNEALAATAPAAAAPASTAGN